MDRPPLGRMLGCDLVRKTPENLTTKPRKRILRGSRSHLAPRFERARQRDLIRILQLASDRHAGRNPGGAYPERLDELREVKRGGFALHVGTGREDDLG